MSYPAILASRKNILVLLVVSIYLIYLNGDFSDEFGPEDLEAYRAELSEWINENIEQYQAEQRDRNNRVREVCNKYGISGSKEKLTKVSKTLGLVEEEWSYLKRVNWHYIYYAKKQSLVWCKVPKAGSSTWTYNFLKLAGQSTNSSKIHKLLREYFPKQDRKSIFKDAFKFMVVRHPFERILSAYRDKLEDISRDLEARDGYYYTMYGKHIVAEYRERGNKNLTKMMEPTWREFVTYLINTPVTKFDEHWMPIWMLCSPCILRYNVIAKMESFAEDTQFTLEQAGLDSVLEVEWKHRTGTGGSSDTIMDYYSELTESEIAELFRKYQLDFELYGYSPEPYFDIAKKENVIEKER